MSSNTDQLMKPYLFLTCMSAMFGGEVQKNILSILLLAPASVGEQYCLVSPERLVASQEYSVHKKKATLNILKY